MTDVAIRAWAPGRVNLIGEHTDYNAGLVLPIAIERGVAAAVTQRDDDLFTVVSAQVPDERVSVDTLVPGAVSGWAAYVLGAVWAVAQATGRGSGLDIAVDGDVPLGAGLSSSAAVECAVVLAVAAAWKRDLELRHLARLAQQAENDFVGVPSGSMDQIASLLGRKGEAVLFDVRDDSVRHIHLGRVEEQAELVVVDTRAAHELVDGGYAQRRRQCEEAARILGVPFLREVEDPEAASRLLEPTSRLLARRMHHVVSEIARVEDACRAIESGDVGRLGELMIASHTSLRDDFEVSSVIALVPRGLSGAVEHAVREEFRAHGFGSPKVWRVSAGRGAHLRGAPLSG